MAHANANGGTVHIGEGVEVPAEVPAGVRLVGPGAGEVTDQPAADVFPSVGEAPAGYASYPVTVLRDLARERGITQRGAVKADLAAALTAWDASHPEGD